MFEFWNYVFVYVGVNCIVFRLVYYNIVIEVVLYGLFFVFKDKF